MASNKVEHNVLYDNEEDPNDKVEKTVEEIAGGTDAVKEPEED